MNIQSPVVKRIIEERISEYSVIAQMLRANLPSPDFVVGIDYLQRWWLAKIVADHNFDRLGPIRDHTRETNDHNCYLHRVTGSDDDRALHDHPWPNVSFIIEGEYREHTPIGVFHRKPGDIVFRQADALHRLELVKGPVWSLFITGKKVREWGFACPKGWVHWEVFTSESGNFSGVGRGCGE